MTSLRFHNSLTRREEEFAPLDPLHVRMYVCGPTVYDLAHLGNARPVVVFDVLARLLRRLYPRVTYARNITDVDDKINARSRKTGEPIAAITTRTTADFHRDMAALNCLPPDVEPTATGHIAEMIVLIEKLIARGHAYAAEGHVLFRVGSFEDYGKFSGRSPEELIAGARVDVAAYKENPGDFVLWKPSDDATPGWESPWGRGRPGWHIECSAMSWKHLGETFDIHGGGHDLLFPHHENEIAQSRCAFGHGFMAHTWLHNGMLLVDGEKMSKSLGNFLTVQDILAKGPKAGEGFRYLLLLTHYRSELDYTDERLRLAIADLDRVYRALEAVRDLPAKRVLTGGWLGNVDGVMQSLCDDLNTSAALSELHQLATMLLAPEGAGLALGDRHLTHDEVRKQAKWELQQGAALLGLLQQDPEAWFRGGADEERATIDAAIAARLAARKARDWAEADRIRDALKAQGILLEDGPSGTIWRRA